MTLDIDRNEDGEPEVFGDLLRIEPMGRNCHQVKERKTLNTGWPRNVLWKKSTTANVRICGRWLFRGQQQAGVHGGVAEGCTGIHGASHPSRGSRLIASAIEQWRRRCTHPIIVAAERNAAGHGPALPVRRSRPAAGTTNDQAKLSVARTSASTFSASNAECPEAGVISSLAFGHTLVRSQALASGQTTS